MALASVRYKVGQILFERGSIFRRPTMCGNALRGTPNDFLWKIGREKWPIASGRVITKVINRIPAMTSNKRRNSDSLRRFQMRKVYEVPKRGHQPAGRAHLGKRYG